MSASTRRRASPTSSHPPLSLYGGYSEANRAPVAAELSCSDPEAPCLIESFLASDPPLDQVVAKTWETGVRGSKVEAASATRLDWSLGLFRTETINDILPVVSQTSGRGVFANAGDTLRQGVEANISYKTPRWFFYANYAFIDATFESNIILPSPNNPRATACPISGDAEEEEGDDEEEPLCVFVHPGDSMPGIPQNRFKAGIDYWITQKWKFGGDLVAVSGQYFFGDEVKPQSATQRLYQGRPAYELRRDPENPALWTGQQHLRPALWDLRHLLRPRARQSRLRLAIRNWVTISSPMHERSRRLRRRWFTAA